MAPSDSPQTFILRGFACTADVMEAARVCREAQVPCRLMPRPAIIEGAGCGTVLRSAPADEARVEELLRAAHVVTIARAEVLDRV